MGDGCGAGYIKASEALSSVRTSLASLNGRGRTASQPESGSVRIHLPAGFITALPIGRGVKLLLLPFPTTSSTGKTAQSIIDTVRSTAETLGFQVDLLPGEEGAIREADLILVLGSDRDVLQAFQSYGDAGVPILGVNDATGSAFLTDLSLDDLKVGLRRVSRKEYRLEECNRLSVMADGEPLPSALNEVAIFPSKTAVLMEYKLSIDGEEVYRDYSDGVIVATPTGSSAYAMSAGGPLVLPKSEVFVVVSVNSMDISRRPLVVPATSIIEVSEISARSDCEVVIDGLRRRQVEERVEIRRGNMGRLVRIDGSSPKRMEAIRRIRSSEEIMKMPPSAKLVLKTIEYEGPLTAREIAAKTLLPPRTVRHAISILLQSGLIGRSPHLRDLRSDIFYIPSEEGGSGERQR
jgi:NAD+ kinase